MYPLLPSLHGREAERYNFTNMTREEKGHFTKNYITKVLRKHFLTCWVLLLNYDWYVQTSSVQFFFILINVGIIC